MEGTYPRRCGGGGRAGSPAGGVSSAQLAAFGRAAGGEGELEEERERQGGEVTVLVCLSVPLVGEAPPLFDRASRASRSRRIRKGVE